MDIASLIGLALGFIAVFVGMVLKGASLTSLANPAAILIIIVGTIATIFIGFSMEEIKKVPKLFKVIFTKQDLYSKVELAKMLVGWANIGRREGLLSLENKVEEISDDFIKSGMRMVIDGADPEFIREVLEENIASMEERHRDSALIFTQAGTYAPTLGVLGAVVGLIAALSNLNEIDKLGHLISAAFVATLLGIFTGYVLWHPMANKLKQKAKKEAKLKYLILEGVLSIQSGESVINLRQRLDIFLSTDERKQLEEELANGEKA